MRGGRGERGREGREERRERRGGRRERRDERGERGEEIGGGERREGSPSEFTGRGMKKGSKRVNVRVRWKMMHTRGKIWSE